ncbi:MAG: hypothetical protein EOO08_01325 [Chitinophagaceae bacterium]|nr:MAG: hypothetical protein EOO08_01325 [Chitinophagaceae bacterium]
MTDTSFSPEASLALIHSMIRKTRSNLGANRFYFLFWGWVAFGALTAQFLLKVVFEYPKHYVVWWVIVPAVVITLLRSRKHSRSGARSYVGESMSALWMGVGISFFVLSFIIAQLRGGFLNAYPFYILFYGLGTFISGRLLRFTPMVIGGILNWIIAMGCVFVPYDYQMLLTALALLCSYIIPGYLLKEKTVTHAS